MKWIAKRILLKSHADMDKALTQLISPFVERLRQEEDIIEWYCSKKTEEDGTKPSVRIYLNVDNSKELEILSMLDIFLRERKEIIGWTGKYNDYDPDLPNPSKSNLNQIQKGCEIALKLLKDYPESKSRSRSNPQFIISLDKELKIFLNSINMENDRGPLHFLANNLGILDDYIFQIADYYKNKKKIKTTYP